MSIYESQVCSNGVYSTSTDYTGAKMVAIPRNPSFTCAFDLKGVTEYNKFVQFDTECRSKVYGLLQMLPRDIYTTVDSLTLLGNDR
jgi:hypothetical protein